MKEYKVVSQKDKWFSSKFDPNTLQTALNSFAEQGWRLISIASAEFPGALGGKRNELIMIMERDV